MVEAGGCPEGLASEYAGEDEEEGEADGEKGRGAGIAEGFEARADGGAVLPGKGEDYGGGGECDGEPKSVVDEVEQTVVFADDDAEEESGTEEETAAEIGTAGGGDEEGGGNDRAQDALGEFGDGGFAAVENEAEAEVECGGSADEPAEGGGGQEEGNGARDGRGKGHG